MATKDDLSKDQRTTKAYNAFRRITKDIAPDKRKAADGLMRRLAFMQVTLEDLEADINKYGATELFSQTEGIEYERERPAVRIYNTTVRNYSAACKQLFDLLPDGVAKAQAEDELMAFVKKAARA